MRIKCGVCGYYNCHSRGHRRNDLTWALALVALVLTLAVVAGIGWGAW